MKLDKSSAPVWDSRVTLFHFVRHCGDEVSKGVRRSIELSDNGVCIELPYVGVT